MNSAKVVEALLINPLDSTKQMKVRGHYVTETDIVIADLIKTAAFESDELDNTVEAYTGIVGDTVTAASISSYSTDIGYLSYFEGLEITAPKIKSEAIDGGKTIVTITFNGNVDQVGDAATFKASIEEAEDGSTFIALDGADTVAVIDGTSNTIVITLDSAWTLTTNKIKFLAGGIKSTGGTLNAELVSGAIDAS